MCLKCKVPLALINGSFFYYYYYIFFTSLLSSDVPTSYSSYTINPTQHINRALSLLPSNACWNLVFSLSVSSTDRARWWGYRHLSLSTSPSPTVRWPRVTRTRGGGRGRLVCVQFLAYSLPYRLSRWSGCGPSTCVCPYLCPPYLLLLLFGPVREKEIGGIISTFPLLHYISLFFRSLFLWCLAIYMSSRRRLSDAKTSRPCYERLADTIAAGCTDTRARPITGPSSPPPETRPAISSPVPYPWQWSCPCRSSANRQHNHRHLCRRRFRCPTKRRKRDEGT